MNTVRNIQKLNEIELANAVPPESSWHTDYRDTAYIYIGGLPYELSEGDIITIFSQFGEPVYIKLVRDKETGKSKGFCFLKYEDQRSTDLAVDNLSGATIMGRTLRVDHTRYKKKDDEDEGDNTMPNQKLIDEDNEERRRKKQRTDETESESEEERPLLPEEIELQKLMREHDDEDPMKAYMVKQKKEEVETALKKWKKAHKKDRKHRDSKRRHRDHSRDRDRDHHHRHRHRRDRSEDRGDKRVKEERSPARLKSLPERRRSPDEDRRRPRRDRSRSREHRRRRSPTPSDSEEEYRRRRRRRSPSARGDRDRSPDRERDRKPRRRSPSPGGGRDTSPDRERDRKSRR